MKMRFRFYFLGAIALISLTSCFTLSQDGGDIPPVFEKPPERTMFSDQEIFNQALELQEKGQFRSAIELWKQYLKGQPQSFEGLNNLGWAYFSNDQLSAAIKTLESALALVPDSTKVKTNLQRALNIRVTLSKENREYTRAISDLKKMGRLAKPATKEKILRQIEQLQAKLFKQVEQVDTLEEYEGFLRAYPQGVYAEKAKKKIVAFSPQLPEHSLVETRPKIRAKAPPRKEIMGGDEIEEITTATAANTPTGTEVQNLEVAPQLQAPSANDVDFEKVSAAILEMPPTLEQITEQRAALESPIQPPPAREEPAQASRKVRTVKVTTQKDPLNVRREPSTATPVIGKVGKGTVHRVLEENAEWFRILFSKERKRGWISKKYSQEVK